MTSLEDRFEAKVDRTGDHHLWTGARRPDGTGHLKVDGKPVLARRVAWELECGELPPGAQVASCPGEKACVRVDHLSVIGGAAAKRPRRRRSPGEGSLRKVSPGTWKLTVARGRYDDGSLRRVYPTIKADTEAEANREAARIIAELDRTRLPFKRDDRDLTVDAGIERFLEEYLRDEKGREARTIHGYRQVHKQWFSPVIGQRRIRDLDEATFDKVFAKMRRAGLSTSRMKEALKLYRPFLRWAKRRGIIRYNPLADFELPKSSYVARRRVPPEVDQLCLLLNTAVEHTPDIAPILTLAAVTGMRRGELVAIRRSNIRWSAGVLEVEEAADMEGTKRTKTDTSRRVSLDDDTVDMLQRHDEHIEQRAADCGIALPADAFMFSPVPDGSERMDPDYLTRQLAKVKDALGIPDKHPATIALEDQALRLFRQGTGKPPTPGRPGPRPKGAMSYPEIGKALGRSEKWAWLAVAAAQRREQAAQRGDIEWFDGSLLGLRKFTSSELLDAGFNIATVAERQGHTPQVLATHYTKSRNSADRKAATHLGRLIHQHQDSHDPPSTGLDGL